MLFLGLISEKVEPLYSHFSGVNKIIVKSTG